MVSTNRPVTHQWLHMNHSLYTQSIIYLNHPYISSFFVFFFCIFCHYFPQSSNCRCASQTTRLLIHDQKNSRIKKKKDTPFLSNSLKQTADAFLFERLHYCILPFTEAKRRRQTKCLFKSSKHTRSRVPIASRTDPKASISNTQRLYVTVK